MYFIYILYHKSNISEVWFNQLSWKLSLSLSLFTGKGLCRRLMSSEVSSQLDPHPVAELEKLERSVMVLSGEDMWK